MTGEHPKFDVNPRSLRARTAVTGRHRPHHHHVYVVERADPVWNEARFRRCNPDHQLGKPLVYVGMTGLDPDLRFDRHKAGIQANRYVFQYGQRLLPHLYEVYNPMPYAAACEMEVELGIALREAGMGSGKAEPHVSPPLHLGDLLLQRHIVC